MSEPIDPVIASRVSPNRLLFGFFGAAAAWIVAGIVNVFLAWQACMGGEAGSAFFTQTGVRIVLGAITFALLALGTAAGVISFNNWRKLTRAPDFVQAEGRDRQEFMAIFGVFVSAALVGGMIWFAIPIYMLRMCVRAH